MDMGCGSQLPYGAASLEHFLNASRVLFPTNRNVFILTDDPKWVRAETRKYYLAHRQHHHFSRDTMKIFTLPARPNHRGGTYNSSIDFWASILLARQCQGQVNGFIGGSFTVPLLRIGVVGHRGSAAFEFIYKNMCFFHNNQFMKCPPLFSIDGPP